MGVQVGFVRLVFASVLIVSAMLVSRRLKFGLEKDLGVAAARTVVQLILIGYVLTWVVESQSAWLTTLIFFVMTAVAAHAARARSARRDPRSLLLTLVALVLSVWPIGIASLFLLIGDGALRTPGQSVPFFGLLLGNSLSAISLALIGTERMEKEGKEEAESLMAIGATPWEAAQRIYREIARTAVTPILNGMTVVGIVSLPGVMAGQILAGAKPIDAAKFQIIVMFLIAATSVLGSAFTILFRHRSLFAERS